MPSGSESEPVLWICVLSRQQPGVLTPKKQGLDGHVIPKTWWEFEVLAVGKYHQEMETEGEEKHVLTALCVCTPVNWV